VSFGRWGDGLLDACFPRCGFLFGVEFCLEWSSIVAFGRKYAE
jgi:hypothetical protein